MSKEAVIFLWRPKATFIETLVTSLQLNLNYIFQLLLLYRY